MFNPNNLFNSILLIPILNILIGLYKLLLVLRIPGALGFSLIMLTVIIRLILYPLTSTQLKSTHKLAKLKPLLDKLNEKYKNDKARLHQEQLKLYHEAGINPAAGCLPLLLQMPILIALYNLFFQLLSSNNLDKVVDGINNVVYFAFLKISTLDLSFLGFNLAHKPSEWQTQGFFLLTIPVITALLQYWQTKMMTPQLQTTDNPASAGSREGRDRQQITEKTKNGKDVNKKEDMGTAMQKQMTIMMPLMIGFFAYSFPLGLSLYWNTFTVFGIIQQYQVNKHLEQQDGDKNKNRKN